jgi:hypothetical protein
MTTLGALLAPAPRRATAIDSRVRNIEAERRRKRQLRRGERH